MRPTGDSHRRALSPADKPRDAEAMDAGVARTLDPQLAKSRAEAGVKVKRTEAEIEADKAMLRRRG